MVSPGAAAAKHILPKGTLSPKVLKEIAKIRIKALQGAHELGASGLESYIFQLKKLHSKVQSDAIKKLLEGRIGLAEKTLRNVHLLHTKHGVSDVKSKSDGDGLRQALDRRQQIYKDYVDMPIDLRIITIRAMLDPALLRRMAWQFETLEISKGFFPEALSHSDARFLKKYLSFLESFKEPASKSPLAQQVLKQTIREVEASLYSYRQVQRVQTDATLCRRVFGS